ncbi:MAG: hypothetical protein WCZ17_03025 [Candidatus Kapaibacterium sp.]
MKKAIILIILYLLSMQLQSRPIFATPIDYARLGAYLSSEHVLLGADENGLEFYDIFYFRHGCIIKWYHGGRITTIVGYDVDGDGGWTKSALQIINDEAIGKSNKNIDVYVYEAKDIAAPNPIQHKILNGEVDFKIQNLDLKLEKGKLYFIVFCDEKGAVLHVKKLILAE